MAKSTPKEREPGADRHYRGAVLFRQAFDIQTLIALSRRTVPQYPLFLVYSGLAIAIARFLVPIAFSVPLPRALESEIAGTLLGVFTHSFFAFSIGTFISAYAQVAILAEVGRWVRGEEEPDVVAALMDWEMGLQGVVYEGFAFLAGTAVSLPFFIFSMVLAVSGLSVAASVALWWALFVQFSAWIITRPGQWGLAIDDLPPKYALLQSVGAAVHHPATLIVLFAAYGFFVMTGAPALCLGSFLVIGAFHCAVGGAWVLFGSSAEEIDANELLAGLVEFERVDPL